MAVPVRLDHRSVLSVAGPDAATFLHGLLTAATLDMTFGQRRYAALLTPQGKVIADLMLDRSEDGFLIDCASLAAPALLKRLQMFRLRAAVTIAQRPDLAVTVFEGAPDPRSEAAPRRIISVRNPAASAQSAAYHAARIAAGLPEQGVDFGLEDVFPADINMDIFSGVDFRKGCFVGQEVVSRMKRRSTARRRTLGVRLPEGAPLTPAPILADGFEIGALTSTSGELGLARIRIDRMAEAHGAGHTFTAAGLPLVFSEPSWLASELAALAETRDQRA